MNLMDLFVQITGDNSNYKKALKESQEATESFAELAEAAGLKIATSLSLVGVGVAAIEAGKEFEEASIKMQRATGATGEALKGMEEQFASLYKTNTQSADAIAGALSLISQKTEATGKDLEDLTAISLQFAKVTGSDVAASVDQNQKLFSQWGIATNQQSTAMDKMVVVSQATGITAAALGQSMLALGATLRTMGFSFDESTALIGNFSKHGIDAQSVIGALNKAMGVFAKEGITDTKAALEAFVAKLQQAPDEATALKIAVETLGGKAGALVSLVDAARLAGFSIDELVQKQQDATGTVAKLADATQSLSGMFTKLEHQLQAALEPLGKGLITAAADAITALSPLLIAVGNVLTAFGELPGYVEASIAALIFFGANPITLGILGVAAAVGILASAFTDMTAASTAMDVKFSTWISGLDIGAKTAKDFAWAQDQINTALEHGLISATDAEKALTLLKAAQDKTIGAGFSSGLTVDLSALKGSATAPEATETLKVTDKLKGIKDETGAMALWVAQENIELAVQKSVVEQTAKYNETVQYSIDATGKFAGALPVAVTAIEFLTGKVAEAILAFRGYLEVEPPFASMTDLLVVDARKAQAGIDALTGAIITSQKVALDADPYAKLADGAQYFGLTTTEQFEKIATVSGEKFDQMLKTGLATEHDLAVAALKTAQAEIDADHAAGTMNDAMWQAQRTALDADLKAWEGHDEKVKVSRYDLSKELVSMVHSEFTNIESAIATDIVTWKGWADSIKSIGTTLAEDFLKIMLKGLFKPLEDQAAKTAASIVSKIGGLFSSSGGAAGVTGAIPIGAVAPDLASIASGGASAAGGVASAAGGTASAVGSAASSLSSVMGIVGGISAAVGAVSSIVGNFQMAGMNKTLDLIENYTRYLKIGLVEQGDSLLNDSHMIRNTLTDFMKFNWGVLTPYLQGMSIDLDSIAGGGKGGGGGNVFNFYGASLDDIKRELKLAGVLPNG
jgi:hypothetical protein